MKEREIDLEEDLLDEEEDTQKDKYLTFHIGSEFYAIEIQYVTEIIGIQKITCVPDMPEFVKGVINLRGKVIPLVDVRIRFRLQFREYNDRTCIIVVDINNNSIGLIVDEVAEVLNIPENQVDPAPRTSKGSQSRFIKGIGKVGDQVKIILDIDRFLNDEELSSINAPQMETYT